MLSGRYLEDTIIRGSSLTPKNVLKDEYIIYNTREYLFLIWFQHVCILMEINACSEKKMNWAD